VHGCAFVSMTGSRGLSSRIFFPYHVSKSWVVLYGLCRLITRVDIHLFSNILKYTGFSIIGFVHVSSNKLDLIFTLWTRLTIA